MRLTELLKVSIKGVLANPKRSFLSTLGIIIGIASVITILSLGAGVKHDTFKNLNTDSAGKQTTEIKYFANADNETQTGFNASDLLLIRTHYPNCIKAKIGNDSEETQLPVTINDAEKTVPISLIKNQTSRKILCGRNLTSSDFAANRPVALISKRLAIERFKACTNAIDSSIIVGTKNYSIIGVTARSKYDVILPQRVFLQGQAKFEGDHIKLTFKKGVDINQETKKIAAHLERAGSHHLEGVYNYTDMGELLKGISRVISGLTYFITAVAGISLLIAGIGVMNMMYISVAERTQEIGIRMSLGASSKNIMAQFLIEALFVTCFGGIFGFLIGISIAKVISNFLPFNAVVTANALIISIGVSTFVGLIFGILPAKSAARKKPN